MESTVLFLGTGHGQVGNKQVRATGGILLLADGYQFLLDPGPGTCVRIKQAKIDIRMTTALLISHAHLMHCNDANTLIGAMTHNGLDQNGVLIANETFVKGSEDIHPVLTKKHKSYPERIIVPKAGQKIGIEHVEIHSLATKHSDEAALGFKFFTKNFVLSYTGDTGYDKSLVEQYLQSDILILNMPHLDKKDEFNLNKETATKLIAGVKPRLAILTHFGSKVLSADPIQIARTIQQDTGVQTVAARDGFQLSPEAYSASLQTKTLNLFTAEAAARAQPGSLKTEKALQDSNDSPFL